MAQVRTRDKPTADSADESYLSLPDAARLALITTSRLKRWIAIGAVTPSQQIVTPDRETIASGFTLADVGYLHLLRHLTHDGSVPFDHAVRLLAHFIARFGPPGPKWHEAVVGRGGPGHPRVVAYAPDEYLATLPIPGKEGAGQRYLAVLGSLIPDGVTLESLLIPVEFLPYVEINPRKEGGQPVVRGTRIRTEVVRAVVAKYGLRAVTEDYYPHIPEDSIGPVIRFENYLDMAA